MVILTSPTNNYQFEFFRKMVSLARNLINSSNLYSTELSVEGHRVQWNKHLYSLDEVTLQYSMAFSIENYNRTIRILPSVYISRKEEFLLTLILYGFTCLLSSNDWLHNEIIDENVELVFQ